MNYDFTRTASGSLEVTMGADKDFLSSAQGLTTRLRSGVLTIYNQDQRVLYTLNSSDTVSINGTPNAGTLAQIAEILSDDIFFDFRVSKAQLDTLNRRTAYVQTSGTNTYTATISPAPTAHATGDRYLVRIMSANTAVSPTFNPNGLGAKPIVKQGSQQIQIGDLRAGQIFWLVYDGNNYQVVSG